MSTSGPFIRRYAVLVYFALVFFISWGGVVRIVGPHGLPLRADEFANLGTLLYIAILAGPTVSGVLLTAAVDGRPGLRQLMARLRRLRAGWSWYAVALLPALVRAATALVMALASPDFRPAILDSGDRSGILLRALLPALLVGSFEEIGWTGFAAPHLRARHSILMTGLAVGFVWGLWHLPLFWETGSFSAALPLAILVTKLFAWLPPFRVLLVWAHERTGSLPLVMLMHAAVSFVSIVLAPTTLTGTRLLTALLASAAATWLLLAAVGVAAHWRLSPPATRMRIDVWH